jgi:antitoxin component of MazEF toxin-antitoxin module
MAKGNARKVLRIGNSYGVTIDRAMLKQAGWGWDTPVSVNLERGRIVIARKNKGTSTDVKSGSRPKRRGKVVAATPKKRFSLFKRTLKARW